ncbi:MAG: ribosomal protein S18-alanine N-acetyltransferase [Clostridia bacterium]|nr:ribosomal protein S18-alanine N-acetyltransferase [Clostridia bacterium]
MTLTTLGLSDVKDIVNLTSDWQDGWSEKMLIDGVNANNLFGFVVRQQDSLVGFLTYTIGGDFSDLLDIVVDKTQRQKGIATLLMQAYFDKLKENKVEKSLLEVRKNNLVAINLYKKHGYDQLYIRTKYYPDGEDALVMEKEIL